MPQAQVVALYRLLCFNQAALQFGEPLQVSTHSQHFLPLQGNGDVLDSRLTASGCGVINMAPGQGLFVCLHQQELVDFFPALNGDGVDPEFADPALTTQRRHGVLSGGHILNESFVIHDQSHIRNHP